METKQYKLSEERRAYCRAYYLEWRLKNREKNRAYQRAHYHANREKMIEKCNRYFVDHPGYKKATYKKWSDANKDKIRVRKRKYDKEKRQSDPLYRLRANLRARIHQAIKTKKQPSGRTMKSTGCTIEFLKGWLESRWLPEMSWDNYGSRGWHVDHVIPCDAFDLSDPEQQLQCFHYTNLQPLWAEDNLKKSNFVRNGTKPKDPNRSAGERAATCKSLFQSATLTIN